MTMTGNCWPSFEVIIQWLNILQFTLMSLRMTMTQIVVHCLGLINIILNSQCLGGYILAQRYWPICLINRTIMAYLVAHSQRCLVL